MKSTDHYLNLAKEKVADEYGYRSSNELEQNTVASAHIMYLEKSALLALSLQQEDAEKDITTMTKQRDEFDRANTQKSDALIRLTENHNKLKAELSQAKEEKEQYRQSIGRSSEDYLLQINRQKNHIEHLQSTLSQEKAKAFDEGCEATIKKNEWKSVTHPFHNPVNPYKQDTQPKQ